MEQKQFDEFNWVDLVHLLMLIKQRILTQEGGSALLSARNDIANQDLASLEIDPAKESLLFQIEAALKEKIGDLAGALHTARSRIDQGATGHRLYFRPKFLSVIDKVVLLQASLVTRARQFERAIMPYYTHMQHAQPGTFAHYLLAQADKLQDDLDRCRCAYRRLNRNPLGTVGRSGTSWSIDRNFSTELLGFSGPVANSLCGRDAEYAIEILAALSFVMNHLSNFATDLHVWCTTEFGLVELPAEYCAISSIFPQKKNPVTLEAIKTNGGMSVNWFGTALATTRGEGTGDQIVHGVPTFFEGALHSTSQMLDLTNRITNALTFKTERAKHLLLQNGSTASELADTIVREHGLTFRDAHTVVHNLVIDCHDKKMPVVEVTPEMLENASMTALGSKITMDKTELANALDPDNFVRSHESEGGVGPNQVARMIDHYEHTKLPKNRDWAKEQHAAITQAKALTKEHVHTILQEGGVSAFLSRVNQDVQTPTGSPNICLTNRSETGKIDAGPSREAHQGSSSLRSDNHVQQLPKRSEHVLPTQPGKHRGTDAGPYLIADGPSNPLPSVNQDNQPATPPNHVILANVRETTNEDIHSVPKRGNLFRDFLKVCRLILTPNNI